LEPSLKLGSIHTVLTSQQNELNQNARTKTVESRSSKEEGQKFQATDRNRIEGSSFFFSLSVKIFEHKTSNLDRLKAYFENLRPDLYSTQKRISKSKRKLENGGVLKLQRGGTTSGHRAGENHLAREDEGGRFCS